MHQTFIKKEKKHKKNNNNKKKTTTTKNNSNNNNNIANKKKKIETKWHDKAIKVAVLGDIASLCALGFPLPLSLQLQQSCLRLNEAMWTTLAPNNPTQEVKPASPATCSP